MIQITIAKLKESFSIKEVQNLDDYLGLRIIRSKDCCKAWLGQPTILTSLEKKFGEDVAKLRTTQMHLGLWETKHKMKQVWSHLISKQSIKVEWGLCCI